MREEERVRKAVKACICRKQRETHSRKGEPMEKTTEKTGVEIWENGKPE